MTKELYDYIQKELNSHDYYDILYDDNDPNVIYLIWKGTDKVFATLEKENIERVMKNER